MAQRRHKERIQYRAERVKKRRAAGVDAGLRGRTRGNRLTLVPVVRETVVTGFSHCGQTLT